MMKVELHLGDIKNEINKEIKKNEKTNSIFM